MAQIGQPVKVVRYQKPVLAPVFSPPVTQPVEVPERERVPVTAVPQKQGA